MDDAADTLSCASFASGPGRQPLFLTEARHDTLAMIRAWSKFDRALLILSGPAQSGKTVLASEFASIAPRSTEVGWVTLDRPGADLAKEVPKAFGLDSADPGEQFARFLAACRRAHKKCLLIVDNAHLISERSTKFLEEVTAPPGGSQTVYVLLVWRGETTALLDAPIHDALRSRLGGHLRLQPFAPAETAQYIAHRFRARICSCHQGRQPFDAGGLRLIHEASGGYPGHIDLLVQHCLARSRAFTARRPDKVFVHSCLAELAEAGRLPYPLPALPEDDEEPEILPLDAPTTRAPDPDTGPGKLAAEDRWSFQMDDPPARGWLKPGIAALTVAGLAAFGGYVLLSPGGPEDRLAATQPVATEQMAPVAAPQQPGAPGTAEVRLETQVEERAPDPRVLLMQALEVAASDPEAAIPFYTRAALWGSERAAYFLGQLHETGIGVEADLNLARAWYLKSPQIAGAAARVRELTADPVLPAAEALATPVPERQVVLGSGETELHWRGPAAGYRIEFFAAGAPRAQEVETSLPAAVIPQPVSRWRVMSLRPDGTPGPASAWAVVEPGQP